MRVRWAWGIAAGVLVTAASLVSVPKFLQVRVPPLGDRVAGQALTPSARGRVPQEARHRAAPVRPVFVGPRGNTPRDTPFGYGFWSFALPVPGVLSRSGQPLLSEFAWLQQNGWKGVVNLRVDGERGGEIGDDRKLPGFSTLGLAYLHLPIVEGLPPTEERAEAFLAFVADPAHLPVHVHCRGGIGRTGVMVALYRYAVQGWPMDTAITESRLFLGGVSALQADWLRRWASSHAPGSHASSGREPTPSVAGDRGE